MLSKHERKVAVRMLEELVKDHKKNCKSDCNISLMFVGIAVKELQDKDLTDEQKIIFC